MKTIKLEASAWYGMCPNCRCGFFVNHEDYYEDGEMKEYTCQDCEETFDLKLPL